MATIAEIVATALHVKKPQLIGIVAGCAVFSITIGVVFYLLYASGSFTKLVEEMRLNGTGEDTRGLGSVLTSKERGETSVPQFNRQPELYDHLLAARANLALCPRPPPLTASLVKIVPFNRKEHLVAAVQASNGSAIFGESAYDINRLWGWLCADFLHKSAFTSKERQNLAQQCFSELFSENVEKGDGCHFVILDMELQKPIGMFSLLDNSPRNLSVRITNLWLTPAFQGTNRVYAVFDLLLGWLVNAGYRRIVAEVDDRNIISRKCLTKAGFLQEAVLYKHKVICDRNSNTVVYTVLNSDWNNVKLKLNKILGDNAVKVRAEEKHKIAEIDTFSFKLATQPKVSNLTKDFGGVKETVQKRKKNKKK